MARKDFLEWFQQRPWLLMPFLAVIPLTGAYLNQRYQPASQSPETPTLTAPSSQSFASPPPLPSPPPAFAQPQKSPASSKAKPSPTPVDPKKYTKEQAAINERTKAALAASMGTMDAFIEMQVAIAGGIDRAAISASQGATIVDPNGEVLHQLKGTSAHTIQPSGDAMTLENRQLPGFVMVLPTAGGVLYLGDKPYRGRFLLAAQGGRLWVVNYIDLRHYLYSVVASEVSPSWHSQALKAQAVAARSYALTYYFRRANPLYHLGSDEYFQVYSGMAKESERTNRAVDATAGEFVSYRGGIVESLYAASDDIVADAFRGKGMSQLGALNLAEQGYSYRQILANYYPKTGVARIEQDHE